MTRSDGPQSGDLNSSVRRRAMGCSMGEGCHVGVVGSSQRGAISSAISLQHP